MKYKLLATLLLATTVISTACEQQATASEYEQNVAALKAECEQLSEENGREYSPIIGSYLFTKSSTEIIEPSGGFSMYTQKMVFDSAGEELVVLDSFTSKNRDFKEHYKSLISKVGEDNYNNKQDPSGFYGICVLKGDVNSFSGDTRNLRKLGNPD